MGRESSQIVKEKRKVVCRWFYRILDVPFVYNVSQVILAPGASFFLKKHFRSLFHDSKGLILDVGCGPKLNTLSPAGIICGVDINFDYVRQYVNQPGQKGVTASAEAMPFSDHSFDEIRSFGLLHHLPEEKVLKVVREMVRCTRPQGRIVIIDNVWPRRPLLRPLAWVNRRFDRGRWVRREEELLDLLQKAYPSAWQQERFTYTLVGHEAVAFVSIKIR